MTPETARSMIVVCIPTYVLTFRQALDLRTCSSERVGRNRKRGRNRAVHPEAQSDVPRNVFRAPPELQRRPCLFGGLTLPVPEAFRPVELRSELYSTATDRAAGVMCDQRIALNGFYVAKDYPEHLRRIRFKDPDSEKTSVFLTNNMLLPPLTIAALYKSRWQVELFFKWIKQHLRIKKFLGTSENAVKTQIWSAVSTYALIAIVKKELQLDASLYTLLQILSVSVFEKTEISRALRLDSLPPETAIGPNQLSLFDS